jgi:iron complex outermembrane receptor protein
MKYLPAYATLAAALVSTPLHAQTSTETSQADTGRTDVETLQTITVAPSADASVTGLSPVFAGGQVAQGSRVGLLGTQSTLDTPFNVVEYTNTLIMDQQAASVADILQNDPGVRVARGYGNYQQLYMIRGFPLYSDDITYNGLYGLLPRQYLASEFIERLDVFRGANTFLNGAAPGGSGMGGTINVVPKRAPNQPLTQATLGWTSGGQGYGAVDIGRRFGPDDNTGIRINAVRRAGGTAVDGEHRRLDAFGLGLDWHSDRVRLSADIGWQDHKLDRSQASINVAAGVPIPTAPDASVNQSPSFTYSDERDLFGTVRGEFDLTKNVMVWAAAGARHTNESSALSTPNVIDTAGNALVSSSAFSREDTIKTGEIGLRAKFDTWGVGHTINASANQFDFDSRTASMFYGSNMSNLYHPSDLPRSNVVTYAGGDLDDPKLTQRTRTTSFAVADTLSFAEDRVLLTLGLRNQRIENKSYSAITGDLQEPVNRSSATTPVAGLVVKATDHLSFYANYIEGLAQVNAAPSVYLNGLTYLPVVNANATFKPVRTKQKEIGIKYDGGSFGGSLALFTTDQPSAWVDPDTSTYGLYGKQRNRGVELTLYGEPLDGLRVLGGVTLLDATMVRTQNGANDGNRAIGVPHTMANLGVEWDVPGVSGLTLTGRAVYTSSEYADAANTQSLPSWTRFDAGARYMTDVAGHAVTLRADVINVANRNYWASAGGYPGAGYLVLGDPRTVMLSATFEY